MKIKSLNSTDDRTKLIEVIKNKSTVLEKNDFSVVMNEFFDIASRIEGDISGLRVDALAVLLTGNVDRLSRVYPDLMSYVIKLLLNSSERKERALLRLLYAERSDLIPKREAEKMGFVVEMSTSSYIFVKISLLVVLVSVLASFFLYNNENLRGIGACAAVMGCLIALMSTALERGNISSARRRELLESVLGMPLSDIAKSYVPLKKENKKMRKKGSPEQRRGNKKEEEEEEEKMKNEYDATTTTTNSPFDDDIEMYKNQMNMLKTLKETAANTGVAKVPLSSDIMETASKLETMIEKSGISNETTESFRHALEFLRKRDETNVDD